jgi:hypothetical protein
MASTGRGANAPPLTSTLGAAAPPTPRGQHTPARTTPRLRNGELRGERKPTKQGFVWEVLSDSPDGESPPHPTPQPAAAARLRDEHVAELRRRVDDQAGEIAELHRLLAQAQQQSSHLLTASAAGESPGRRRAPQDAAPAEWPERRPWSRRLLWS